MQVAPKVPAVFLVCVFPPLFKELILRRHMRFLYICVEQNMQFLINMKYVRQLRHAMAFPWKLSLHEEGTSSVDMRITSSTTHAELDHISTEGGAYRGSRYMVGYRGSTTV